MRLLHTADWHAGRHLSRRGLDEGLEKSLTELVDYAVREKVDAVLVAGDVFDGTKPPHSSPGPTSACSPPSSLTTATPTS